MSSMDDSSDRPTFHRLRSDQENERRRMRDRKRRRSKNSDQRETHLVRRRRNYQVHMHRVKHRDLVAQSGTSNASVNGMNHRQAGVYDPKSALQFSYVAPVGSGKDPLAYDLTKLRRGLRLIHVKHFARSLKRPLGKSIHGVRLNQVKELARGQTSVPKESSEQLPMNEAEGNLVEWNLLPVVGHPPTSTDEPRTEVTVSLEEMD